MSKIGEEIAINTAIRTYREFSLDDAAIIERIVERFHISKEEAIEYVCEKCLA